MRHTRVKGAEVSGEPGTNDGAPVIYEITATARGTVLRITTSDLDYVRLHLRRHMPPHRHEVPATWYAALDRYLHTALNTGHVRFDRYANTAFTITATVANT